MLHFVRGAIDIYRITRKNQESLFKPQLYNPLQFVIGMFFIFIQEAKKVWDYNDICFLNIVSGHKYFFFLGEYIVEAISSLPPATDAAPIKENIK